MLVDRVCSTSLQPAVPYKEQSSLKVVLYGATGKAGSVILKELIDRGHLVIAAARTPEKVRKVKNVTAVRDDLSDPAKTAIVAQDWGTPSSRLMDLHRTTLARSSALWIAWSKLSRRPAASASSWSAEQEVLSVAPGVTLRASGHVPKEWIPIVDAHIQVLRNLKQSSIDWTYFGPAAFFEPGQRIGKFRLGKDDLIVDAQGNSRISFQDYAIALVCMNSRTPSTAGSASPLATKPSHSWTRCGRIDAPVR